MKINTKYNIDEQVIAPPSLRQEHAQQFTVEAIKLDKNGVQYLLCSDPPEYPKHQVRGWVKESEIKQVISRGI